MRPVGRRVAWRRFGGAVVGLLLGLALLRLAAFGGASQMPHGDSPPVELESAGPTANGRLVLNLSNNAGSSEKPRVASSFPNRVYVVWMDRSPGNREIFFTRSTDGGRTFEPTRNLSNSAIDSEFPQIVASGRYVYVAWDEGFNEGTGEVYLRASADEGATFGPRVQLSDNAGFSSSPRVAAALHKVYVVWLGQPTGERFADILFRRSTDGGAKFAPQLNLSRNLGFSTQFPRLAAHGDHVYVAWTESSPYPSPLDVFFRRSLNAGASFGGVQRLSRNQTFSSFPEIALAPQPGAEDVYVAWGEDTRNDPPYNPEILVRRSTNSGGTFASAKGVSRGIRYSWQYQIAAAGTNVHLVWLAYRGGYNDLLFARSRDRGATFEAPRSLGPGFADSHPGQVAVFGNVVDVLWPARRTAGDHDIVWRRSSDGGATFGDAVNLSNTSGGSTWVALSRSLTALYVVWQDGTPGNQDIFFTAVK